MLRGRRFMYIVAVAVLLSACSRPTAQEKLQQQVLGGSATGNPAAPAEPPTPAASIPPAPKPPDEDLAAAALGLKPEQVLNWKTFEGGSLGGAAFAGGRVLVWESEPDRLTAQALYVRDGV